MKLKELRKKHPRFIYENFAYSVEKSKLAMVFRFLLEPNTAFDAKVTIHGIRRKQIQAIPKPALENLIFHLGLAEIPSYWKCACSPHIVIKAGALSTAQISFWKDLLLNGLGEFFYQNRINPYRPGFFDIKTTQKSPVSNRFEKNFAEDRFLVSIGGGKDSLVTVEILKKAHKKFRPLILGNVPAAFHASRASSPAQPITIERTIDPRLLELNRKGYLNGHTPFSSYLAFLSMLSAALFGFNHIVASQERSADEENVQLQGYPINHQYSKSYAFEKKFRAYTKKHLASSIFYFSLLRPLYELQIARIFSRLRRYFTIFKSCNVFLKKNSWCGKCPKCFSTYLLFAPFIQENELVNIFGRNLLNDKALWRYIPSFLGSTGPRPFDCIGTKRETSTALCLALGKYRGEDKKLPHLLKRFSQEMAGACNQNNIKILNSWNSKNFVPSHFIKIIKKEMGAV